VTKKLPFIISEFEMVQATFWNTNNGGTPPCPPSARQALLFEESVSKLNFNAETPAYRGKPAFSEASRDAEEL